MQTCHFKLNMKAKQKRKAISLYFYEIKLQGGGGGFDPISGLIFLFDSPEHHVYRRIQSEDDIKLSSN